MAAEWDRQVAVIDKALEAFGATGYVLELAGGTGWWTQRLSRTAGRSNLLSVEGEVQAPGWASRRAC